MKYILYSAVTSIMLLLGSTQPGLCQETGRLPAAAWETAVRFNVEPVWQQRPEAKLVFDSGSGLGTTMPAVLKATADRLGGTVASADEHIHCARETLPETAEEVTVCRMSPTEMILRLHLKSASADSAVVEVSSQFADSEGNVEAQGHRLLLKKGQQGWVVKEVLMSWAS